MDRRRNAQGRSSRAQIIIHLLISVLTIFSLLQCSSKIPKDDLPEPIIEDNPELIDLYWKAWSLIHQSRSHGNRINAFPKNYLNITGNDVLDQWSTLSSSLFTIYGYYLYPVMQTLDLFYDKQRSDGFISRVYLVNSGDLLHIPTQRNPMIHPPLFTWVELKYFEFTADTARVQSVFPVLEKYFLWLDSYCRGKEEAANLYCSTPTGSGMMNLPRGEAVFGGWTDISAQMAMFADHLRRMAQILGNDGKSSYYRQKHLDISESIRTKLWHSDSTFYYHITREGKHVKINTVAGFWPLLAKVPDGKTAQKLINHLKDPGEFKSPHMFPSVSMREQEYNPKGFYWRGGVWGITNYMIIQGLMEYGEDNFAREAAWNHISNISKVFFGFPSDTLVDFNVEKHKSLNTIWELYAPEGEKPGTRLDAIYGQKDYIAFSGHGPIAMLIENILGFNVEAPADKLTWTIHRTDKHGVKRLRFGDNSVSVWTDRRTKPSSLLSAHGETESALQINFIVEHDTFSIRFDPGPIEVTFIPDNFILKERFLP